MERIIEHLGLLKDDLREAVATLSIENSNLIAIVEECGDKFAVKRMKKHIEDNEDIIYESKETLIEANFVIALLESNMTIEHKKRP